MSRWSKITLGVLAGGVLVLVTGPWCVEWYAGRRADAVLAERGPSISWEEVDWWWGSDIAFVDMRLESGGTEVRVDRLTARVDPGAALGGQVELKRLRVAGVGGRIDLPGLRRRLQSLTGGSAGAGAAGPEAGGAGGGPVARLASVERMDVENVHVTVGAAGVELATLEGSGHWQRRASAPDELKGAGAVELGARLGGGRRDWSFEGTVRASKAIVEGRWSFSEPLSVPLGPLRLEVAAVEGRLGASGQRGEEATAGSTLHGLEVATGHAERSALAVEVPKLRISYRPSGGVLVETEAYSVSTTPAKLGALIADLRGGAAGSGSGSGGSGGPNLRALAQQALGRFEVSASGGAVELHYRREEEWRRLSLGQSVALYKRGYRMAARGAFGGGRVEVRSDWFPGRLIPASMAVEATDVELEEVPVIREGRNLPSKGVRGRIGGRVDMAAAWIDSGETGLLSRKVSGTLDFSWKDGWVEAGGLADEPVEGIELDVQTGFEWRPATAQVQLLETDVRYGPVRAAVSGSLVDWPLAPRLELGVSVDKIGCQEAIRSLPEALLGPYDDIEIDGETAPRLHFAIPFLRPKELSFDLEGFPGECEVEALHTDPEGWPELDFREEARRHREDRAMEAEHAREMQSLEFFDLGGGESGGVGDADAESEAGGETTGGVGGREALGVKTDPDPRPEAERRRAAESLEPIPSNWSDRRPDDVFWLRKPFVMQLTRYVSEDAEVRVGPGLDSYVGLGEMPAYLAAAAYLSEEIEFYTDGAWNTNLIRRALKLNFSEERFVYGGSTVTQQLVKNLFLTREKTLARKIREALIAWRIQGTVSKDRVLELYLNCIEYGEDLYGIGPAARHYFDKPASELGVLEAVFLATIKPAPWYGGRFLRRGKTREDGWWPKRMGIIVERLRDKGFITEREAEAAKPYVVTFPEHRQKAAREAKRREERRERRE